MTRKLIKIIKGTIFLGILAVGLLIKPDHCFADQAGSKQEGIIELDKDTAYEYDLNGDGKAEKIQYTVTVNEDKDTVALKLYINDKLCLSRNKHGFNYAIKLCDIDKSDNYKDLYCFAMMESDCINDAFFVRYDGDKLVNMVKFPPKSESKVIDTIRFSLEKTDGDGKFTFCVDTPVFSDAIGCYCCDIPYQLKNNKITRVPVTIFSLNKYSKKYQYKVKKGFSVYDKVGSKTVAFKVKKGEKVTFDQLYLKKSKMTYFRIVNHNGKKGWIKSVQKGLFSNVPMWG